MNTINSALLAFAREILAEQARNQAFDFTTGKTDAKFWQELEARARATDPAGRWLCRFVYVVFEDGVPMTEPVVLSFETAPCAEELNDAVIAEAARRGYHVGTARVLVFNALTDQLDDLASYERRHDRPRSAARTMLRRAGQGTVPARQRRLATA